MPGNYTFWSFPSTPVYGRSRINVAKGVTGDAPTDTSDSEDELLRFSVAYEARRKKWSHRLGLRGPQWRRLRQFGKKMARWWKGFNEFMTVPLWASVASIIVACTPPVQHQLEEHTQPLKGALQAAGSCSIPVTLVVLGGYFFTPTEESSSDQATITAPTTRPKPMRQKSMLAARKDPSRPGETATVVVAVVSRMILTPLILFPLFVLSTRFDWHAVFEE